MVGHLLRDGDATTTTCAAVNEFGCDASGTLNAEDIAVSAR